MDAFLVSTGMVALAEIGDKTQLLTLVLASRFRRPVPIILGILLATLANHALAGALGEWFSHAVGAEIMRWVLAASFLAMAVWALIPDGAPTQSRPARLGVFATTLLAFFLIEMGDKTQVATAALAAQHAALFSVVAGSTLGMMLANVPAVFLGDRIVRYVPLKLMRCVAAALFVAIALYVLLAPG